MKNPSTFPRPRRLAILLGGAALGLAAPDTAQASMFQGETLDAFAEVLSWLVLIVVPVVLITVFWLVHILPEKIAEKKGHPQTKAIQCLCLLSLVFGGLLWPFAWLWTYSKPVGHKLAYGTDVDEALLRENEEKRREKERKKQEKNDKKKTETENTAV